MAIRHIAIKTQEPIFHTADIKKFDNIGPAWRTYVRCKKCTKAYGKSMFLSSNGKILFCPRCSHKEEVKK